LYLVDVEPAEIKGPLAQFQAVRADRDATLALLTPLNNLSDGPKLSDGHLQKAFDLWWPQLDTLISAIPGSASLPTEQSLHDKIDQVLARLDKLAGIQPTPTRPPLAGVGPSANRPGPSARPRVFIGSSSEGLAIAQAIQQTLDPIAECTIWNQGVFSPSSTFVESLQDAHLTHDFAVIVLTPNDTATSRGRTSRVPRDNLLFELGYSPEHWAERAHF
jgi:hypothetical protein